MSGRVLLAHGAGGLLSQELVASIFARRFANPYLDRLDDAAILPSPRAGERLAFTTDGYVVRPLFFPGGDIGRLAVCGTVNDLAVMGALPRHISAAFVLEEGLPFTDLERIAASMAVAAQEAGVQIVTGDTKVVERGHADGCFITTAGVGLIPAGVKLSGANARAGDAVLLSGSIGDHGLAVLSQREGLRFAGDLRSDVAPLNGLVQALLTACPRAHTLRDPTRGGLAVTLNEIARQSQVSIAIEESAIPICPAVRALSEMLGLDPLYVANEGKLVAIVPGIDADAALAALRAHPLGREAALIGTVQEDRPGRVTLRSTLGSHRILDMPAGELLPRIC